MNNFGRNILFWLALILVLVLLYDSFGNNTSTGNYTQLAFSDFLNKIDDGTIRDVTIQGHNIDGHLNDGRKFTTYSPNYPDLVERLRQAGIKIEAVPLDSKMNSILGVLISWFPGLLIVGVWIYLLRNMQGGGKAMGIGRSRAKMLNEQNIKVTFKDVAGVDDAKEDLSEIVDFLKDPKKFHEVGGRIPKGCLLMGSPGTGKTLLARAIAGEAGVSFFSISGSEFVEMFVGVGASRVRDLFEQAKKSSPCIIFIDEIDAVGRSRSRGGSYGGGGHDEREQTLNQLLVEMDGFEESQGIIIIAATNRPDVLDKALLRPGRFDRQISVSLPDLAGREAILSVHAKKVKLAPDVNLKIIARGTPGFSGADLANLINEAALLTARFNRKVITMKEFDLAKDKILMGAEKKSLQMSDDEKKLTAYHEGGHAVVAFFQSAADPIHKATIIPRGRALGMVQQLPERDQVSQSFEKLKAKMAIYMGGRVAEEVIFGTEKVTSGASSDIKGATAIAKAMVESFGMSDKVGTVCHETDENPYMPKSENIANLIDSEVKKFIDEAYAKAKEIITTHLDKLHELAKILLELETLTGDEIKDILEGRGVNRIKTVTVTKPRKSSILSPEAEA